MSLCQFLHFNDRCPVCDKPLTLYMYVSRVSLWKATEIRTGEYKFTHSALKKVISYSPQDYMMLYDHGEIHDTWFNTSRLGQDSKTWDLFFFKVCNEEAVSDHEFDYDLDWYQSCYYRSSPWYRFQRRPKDSKKGQLEIINQEHQDLPNRDESFVFKKMLPDGKEKVYLLNLDYENQKTKFYHYSITMEQRFAADFEPQYFEQDNMPLMRKRPDLDLGRRDQLLDRLDTWVLFG